MPDDFTVRRNFNDGGVDIYIPEGATGWQHIAASKVLQTEREFDQTRRRMVLTVTVQLHEIEGSANSANEKPVPEDEATAADAHPEDDAEKKPAEELPTAFDTAATPVDDNGMIVVDSRDEQHEN